MRSPYAIKQGEFGEDLPSGIPRNEDGDPVEDSAPIIIPDDDLLVLNSRDTVQDLSDTIRPRVSRVAAPIAALWKRQESMVSSSDIRNHGLSQDALNKIEASYRGYVTTTLGTTWLAVAAIGSDNVVGVPGGARGIVNVFPATGGVFSVPNLPGEAADTFIRARELDLVDRLTAAQRRASQTIIQTGLDTGLNERVVARQIRTTIGLDAQQLKAVRNLRASLAADGVAEANIEAAVARMTRAKRIIRAKRIARTEMTWSYNMGQLDAVRAYRDAGWIPRNVVIAKKWRKVLPVPECFCDNLNGQIVGLESTFPGMTPTIPNTLTPPAHPNCACVIDIVVQRSAVT